MVKRILFINIRSHKVERMEPLIAAKKLGIEVVLLADTKPKIDDGYVLPDNYIITDTYNMEQALRKVIEFAKEKPIHGVLTWSDKDVELVSLIANELKIPAPSIASSKNARNKFLMRKAIAKHHPELCPNFQRVTNFAELKKAIKEIGLPGVFKPVGASGSKTIIKIYEASNLEEIFKRVEQETSTARDKVYSYFPNEFIYEELLVGDEISIEGIVSSATGKIIIAGMTDKYVTDEFSTEYKEIEPSQKSKDLLKIYREKIKLAIQALGIENCAFHAECKVDGEKLKVIEIAARPGGGFITTHLVAMASGVSFIEENIKNALGFSLDEKLNFENWAESPKMIVGQQDFLANKEGKVTRVGGLQDIFEDSNVKFFFPLKEVGDVVLLPPKDYHSLFTGTVIVASKDINEIHSSLKLVEEKYKVNVE